MNDPKPPGTGPLKRDFKNELIQAAVHPNMYQPDMELIARMRQTMAEWRKAVEESRRALGLETDNNGR